MMSPDKRAVSDADKNPVSQAAVTLQTYERNFDVLALMNVRHKMREVLDNEVCLLLERVRGLIPVDLQHFMERYLGTAQSEDSRGVVWLERLRKAKNSGTFVDDSLDVDELKNFGFRNAAEAQEKLQRLEEALRGVVEFKL
jgi:hypothetical protein